jgi:DNA-binding winged helix-turn-helix (wHTH) protein
MTPEPQLQFEAFRLDVLNQCLWHGRQAIALPPKAFALLRYLVEHPGRLVTKAELLDAVWPTVVVTDGVLKVCMREVRQALNDGPRAPRYIETVHRRGYRFIAPVSRVSAPDDRPSVPAPDTADATEGSGLIGRESWLAQLHGLWTKALHGERQVVFVTGEPGIGKTALIEAFLAQLGGNPQILLAVGQCVEQYGSGEAYLPMLEALNQLCQQPSAGSLIELLGHCAPTWLAQLPWLINPTERDGLQREIIGATRQRMVREMGEWLERLTRDRPLVLVFEDLHWSDYATLDLVVALATRRQPMRLLLIGTYRPVEAILRNHPLKTIKQDLQNQRRCTELHLPFLSAAQVSALIHQRFPGHEFPAELTRVIQQRSDGNPLFVVNVLDYLRKQGVIAGTAGRWRLLNDLSVVQSAVPESLQQMIGKQIERLAPEHQQLLTVASVAGVEFSTAAVAAGAEQSLETVEESCERLAQAGQFLTAAGVVELPDGTAVGRYLFTHALYRDVLYKHLAPARRVRLHRGIGEWSERMHGECAGEVAAELALHFAVGQDCVRAVDYLRLAARNALQRHANREAIDYLLQALEHVEHLPGSKQRLRARMSVLLQCGLARRALGDMRGAAEDFATLVEHSHALARIDLEVVALIYLAVAQSWVAREQCLATVARIEALSADLPDLSLQACARGWCGYWHLLWHGWRAEDADACAAAVAAMRQADHVDFLCALLNRYSFFQSLRGDYRAACRTSEESTHLALELGDAAEYLLTQYFHAWALLHGGAWDELYRLLNGAIALAEKNEHRLWVSFFRLELAWLHEQAFAFAPAQALAEQGLQQLNDSALPYGQLLGNTLAGLIALGQGQAEAARRYFDAIDGRLAQERILMDWIMEMPLRHGLSRYWLEQGEPERARREAVKVCERAAGPIEPTYLALGHATLAEIAATQSDWAQMEAELTQALSALEGIEAPLAQWRVYAGAAALREQQGQPAAANELRLRSAAVIHRLAATLRDIPDLQQTFIQAAPVQAILGNTAMACIGPLAENREE